MENKNIIGYNIKLIRKSKNISQKQLVAKLNLLGLAIDEPKLSRIEHLKRPVLDYEVLAIAKALDTSISSLFKTYKKDIQI
ncbi:helix-turn-helix transcriptional regulator [Clostridium perfringens]|uniref:helix-turn-helix domain-containing protein n=1 Tax=Clostridium perfringens TaxID=1502 RepID=UPI0013E3557C|nr:helix-turn-helix transcriptional regulator [Clostridium perfringens]EHK2427155.1 helix-turn-helix transcriptional regulator [Clostridium perfringens]EIF6152678.1 helix-turn-helix transcriptional regulator [Clostridium perfringens]ELC8352438.1 helix-turn-helix transcriptional regulator [Clostridium perfringens]ELC8368806.1 helix-turn-helix transcriptional regulator [Clostridium perfringens]ELC8371845.1 helix-turn-helix transcriptional regulator [Clostridium perfringens]